MLTSYNSTVRACFVGYIVQAIANVFAPLLFLTFINDYGLGLEQVTLLTTINFGVQLVIDFASAFFVDKIGYRLSMILAHAFASLGLIFLSFLPDVMPAFGGLLISVLFYAVGGGLLEVVVSPVVEACPGENKDKRMSLLHSFYSWGSVAVIAFSSLFFYLFGVENRRILCLLWAVVPVLNGITFLFVPLNDIVEEGEKGLNVKEVVKNKYFLAFAVVILCAGATEAAVAQWASSFVEKSLALPKALGDILGPCLFAACMGLSRLLYGKSKSKKNLFKVMAFGGAGCVVAYALIVFAPLDLAALFGMALCGFSVGVLWPGTFSAASMRVKNGGNAMFALLALAGDIGCMCGPTLVGFTSKIFNENLRFGILFALIFPLVLTVILVLLRKNTVRKAAEKTADKE